jgi:dipeptidyl-peptidase 4
MWMKRNRVLLPPFVIRHSALILLALLFAEAGFSQGTKTDYERSANLRKMTEGKVLNRRIEVHWSADGNRLWFRRETSGGGREFILVDATKGTRQPAFDHARLATALKKAGVKDARKENLPVDDLSFSADGQQLDFRAGGKSWRCDLQSYELVERPKPAEPAGTAKPLDEAPRASLRTGSDTTMTFVNRTANDVELFWLNTEGQRQSYGRIAPGKEHEQHTFAGHVWLVVDASGKTLATFEAGEKATKAEVDGKAQTISTTTGESRRAGARRSGATSPDGKWRAFVKDNNLWLRDTGSEAESALSTDGREGDAYDGQFFWSPDSKKLVAVRVEPVDQRKVTLIESSPKDQLQPKVSTYTYFKPGDKLPHPRPQLFDVAARRQIPVADDLFPNSFTESGRMDIGWARDSSRFTFSYNQRGHQVFRILAVNAGTGVAQAIVNEECRTFFDYSGKQFQRMMEETGELIWMSERDGWNHLYLYAALSGQVKNQITKGAWTVRGVDRVDEKSRQIFFRAGGIHSGQDPYHVHHCRVDFDGKGLVMLTEGDGTHTIDYSPDKRFIIDTYSRVDLPPVTELRRADDGKLVCEVERAESSALHKTGWRAPERFVAKGRDGTTDIFGIIIRPTNFNPRKKYPVIENIYAGPHGSFVPKDFRTIGTMNELAELGFIIVQIDGMGTSHRSKAFQDVSWKNLGDSGFPDRILWLKAAAKTRPWMDLSRVGIYGGSAGGQSSTRAMLAHGDFYKAAVSDCGCHDNRMDKIWWNEQWMGWPIGAHYEEQSNVTQAKNLQGKLLLIVGELDRNVDPSSTMQVVNALIKADKDFDLLVVPGGGHGIAESPYGKRRRADFFVRHLLGVEPRL